MLLRHSHELETQRKFAILRAHPFFREWPDMELRDAVANTHLRTYIHGAVVFDGFHSHPGESICLLVSGLCRIVRRLPVAISSRNNAVLGPCAKAEHIDRALEPKESLITISSAGPRFRHVLMTGNAAGPGTMFGAWTSQMSAVCASRCTCLLISKVVFMRHDHGRCLESVVASLPMTAVDDAKLYDAYTRQKQWEQYRKRVMQRVVHEREVLKSLPSINIR